MPVKVQPIPFFQLKPVGKGFFFREPRIIPASPLVPAGFLGYTDFYCQASGSNLNAGSDQNTSARYTSVNGNWNGSTIFTPTDSSTPADTVRVGDWASVYLDAASVAASVHLVTAVATGVNGAITLSNVNFIGTVPVSGATGRSLKVGGAWRGPNAASGFPFNLTNYGSNRDALLHTARTNMKNDQTYSITASISVTNNRQCVVQGYTSYPNDGGKATWDGGVSTATIIGSLGASGPIFIDHIFMTSFTSGTSDLVTASVASTWMRCAFKGARATGLTLSAATSMAIECEAYDCNKSNTASKGGFLATNGCILIRCISHDNTGSNTNGFQTNSGGLFFENCIAANNGGSGFVTTAASVNGLTTFRNCDFYNNGGHAISIISTSVNPFWIENCNFVKNGGAGVSNPSIQSQGYIYNCGYGTGSQANGVGDILNAIVKTNCLSYALNTTPWSDPVNGDFRINAAAAISTGRGVFVETLSGYSGAVGYPDIGAAFAQDVGSVSLGLSETWFSDGFVGSVYEFRQSTTGPATMTLVSGALPTGLALSQPNSTTILITGTPTVAGYYTFTTRLTVGVTFYDYLDHITILPAPAGGGDIGGVGGG